MASATLERVALRHTMNVAALADDAATDRNKDLLADVESALSIFKTVQQKTAAARLSEKHESARLKQEDELAKLRAHLAEVQARRDKARADFEAELAARAEAAHTKHLIAAEVELERFDAIERESVRVGVGAQASAASDAVEDGLADAVRKAAAQTREMVSAQVEEQTRWLAEELPALLQAQANIALGRVSSAGAPTDGSAATAAAASAPKDVAPASPPRSAKKLVDAAMLTSPPVRSPIPSPLRPSASAELPPAPLSLNASAAAPGGDAVASGETVPPQEFADAHAALVAVAQSALLGAQRLAAAKSFGDPALVAAAQQGVLAAATAALEFAGKPVPSADAPAALKSADQVAPQPAPWHPYAFMHGGAPMVPPPGAGATATAPAWMPWYYGGAGHSGQPPSFPAGMAMPSGSAPAATPGASAADPSKAAAAPAEAAMAGNARTSPYNLSERPSRDDGAPDAIPSLSAVSLGSRAAVTGGLSSSLPLGRSYGSDDWNAAPVEERSIGASSFDPSSPPAVVPPGVGRQSVVAASRPNLSVRAGVAAAKGVSAGGASSSVGGFFGKPPGSRVAQGPQVTTTSASSTPNSGLAAATLPTSRSGDLGTLSAAALAPAPSQGRLRQVKADSSFASSDGDVLGCSADDLAVASSASHDYGNPPSQTPSKKGSAAGSVPRSPSQGLRIDLASTSGVRDMGPSAPAAESAIRPVVQQPVASPQQQDPQPAPASRGLGHAQPRQRSQLPASVASAYGATSTAFHSQDLLNSPPGTSRDDSRGGAALAMSSSGSSFADTPPLIDHTRSRGPTASRLARKPPSPPPAAVAAAPTAEPTAAAASPAATIPQPDKDDEGAKSAFKSAAASLSSSALSTAAAPSRGVPAPSGRATAQQGASTARGSLSARIMKMGASDSEPSSDIDDDVFGSSGARPKTGGMTSSAAQGARAEEDSDDSDSF